MLEPDTGREKHREEIYIGVFQFLFLLSNIVVELLEIKMSLLHLNPPRLLFIQGIHYISMIIAGIFSFFLHKIACFNTYEGFQNLDPLSATTLTLLDICCDASILISKIMVPSYKVEAIAGLQVILQLVFSAIFFSRKYSIYIFIASGFQVSGYVISCLNVVGNPSEPLIHQSHSFLGEYSALIGIFFMGLAIILRTTSYTMTEALSSSVKLTAGSFCRGNGVWGLLICCVYNYFVVKSGSESLSIPISFSKFLLYVLVFMFFSAIQHYSAFWLVLKTKAVEFSHVWLLSELFMIGIRYTIFREDGAPYGFAPIPMMSVYFTIAGLIFFSFSSPQEL